MLSVLAEVINEPRQALSMRSDGVVLFASDNLIQHHALTPVNALNDVVILTKKGNFYVAIILVSQLYRHMRVVLLRIRNRSVYSNFLNTVTQKNNSTHQLVYVQCSAVNVI